jgi:hypothetical protein
VERNVPMHAQHGVVFVHPLAPAGRSLAEGLSTRWVNKINPSAASYRTICSTVCMSKMSHRSYLASYKGFLPGSRLACIVQFRQSARANVSPLCSRKLKLKARRVTPELMNESRGRAGGK